MSNIIHRKVCLKLNRLLDSLKGQFWVPNCKIGCYIMVCLEGISEGRSPIVEKVGACLCMANEMNQYFPLQRKNCLGRYDVETNGHITVITSLGLCAAWCCWCGRVLRAIDALGCGIRSCYPMFFMSIGSQQISLAYWTGRGALEIWRVQAWNKSPVWVDAPPSAFSCCSHGHHFGIFWEASQRIFWL